MRIISSFWLCDCVSCFDSILFGEYLLTFLVLCFELTKLNLSAFAFLILFGFDEEERESKTGDGICTVNKWITLHGFLVTRGNNDKGGKKVKLTKVSNSTAAYSEITYLRKSSVKDADRVPARRNITTPSNALVGRLSLW